MTTYAVNAAGIWTRERNATARKRKSVIFSNLKHQKVVSMNLILIRKG